MVALNKSTQILINNFIDSHFNGENKAQIKQEALEIADLIAERSDKNFDRFTTKEDLLNTRNMLKEDILSVRSELKEDIASVRSELKEDIASVRSELKEDIASVRSELKEDIANLKYDFLKWLVGSQVAVAGLIIAVLKFT